MTATPTDMNSGGLSTISNDPEERLAYIALALIPRLGARRLVSVLSTFGSASAALQVPPRQLAAAAGLPADLISTLTKIDLPTIADRVERESARQCQVLIPADIRFPAALRTIPDPPTLLWFRGKLDVLQHPAVGIVGSREHTAYGAAVAAMMGQAAAHAGIAVVSGMARGLDAIAQTAALDARFPTIGVIGNGVDVIYPMVNRPLYERVYSDGLLLTEHPPGEEARPAGFARRNRLISGLARAVIVVEAAPGSGTMLTVSSALEQGRDVFAVPGPITSLTSQGTNRLIHDGATPLLNVEQFLAWYGKDRSEKRPAVQSPPCNLSATEAQVFNALADGGRHIDELALAAGLPVGTVLGALLGLELGGIAEQLPGSFYRRRAG